MMWAFSSKRDKIVDGPPCEETDPVTGAVCSEVKDHGGRLHRDASDPELEIVFLRDS